MATQASTRRVTPVLEPREGRHGHHRSAARDRHECGRHDGAYSLLRAPSLRAARDHGLGTDQTGVLGESRRGHREDAIRPLLHQEHVALVRCPYSRRYREDCAIRARFALMSMTVAEIALWTSLFAIAYTYALYPCILFAAYALAQMRSDLRYLTARRDRRCRRVSSEAVPPVSFVIPVFNEAPHLKAKLENLRALDYPKDKLQVIFVCDGSTDGSDDILLKFDDANVRVVCLPDHRGKANALNVGVRYAAFDIVVFSDAATLFTNDAVGQLVRHFVDPRVGVVCGAVNFRGGAESAST